MRPIDPRRATAVMLLALLAGCGAPAGPRPIAHGTPCARCGMEVRDLRFACERAEGKGWRVYDAIECLLADPPTAASGRAYLSDYDRQSLHAADSLWVVKGEFASPMGGGFAAFLSLAAADSIAAVTRGRVDRLAAFVPPPAQEVR
jgi:nitrous oxide reductase accessory protein NosL